MSKPIPPSPTGQPPASNKNSAVLKLAGIILIVIIIVGGGIWLYKHHKNNQTTENNSTDNITQIQQIFEPPAATTTPQATTPATSTPPSQAYINEDLGFQIELGPNWSVKPYSDSEVILADENGAQLTIQDIKNAGTDLDTIKNQLQHSLSVSSIANSTFQNQPALSFNTINGQQGLAFIYNTSLYYIIGHLKNAPLSTFQFLTNFQL